ncbi:hypothetical protein [Asticcacaulis sp. EMRT-3]|uniref:hypothetical protein n=1 Tax=Asticcacaulis sp. EMRT-3 TaxID=3040349 RepID=UPI0024AF799B|nr:hypothetical protein [Asticcacaulis sp. EMRT-3]MDI7774127.1 hypothetical protein [Asticcacaulis sp. EMRT-3]
MASSSLRTTHDLRHQQNDILDYIHEIVQELADMAMRAGHEDLADNLRSDIARARDSHEDSPDKGNPEQHHVL